MGDVPNHFIIDIGDGDPGFDMEDVHILQQAFLIAQGGHLPLAHNQTDSDGDSSSSVSSIGSSDIDDLSSIDENEDEDGSDVEMGEDVQADNEQPANNHQNNVQPLANHDPTAIEQLANTDQSNFEPLANDGAPNTEPVEIIDHSYAEVRHVPNVEDTIAQAPSSPSLRESPVAEQIDQDWTSDSEEGADPGNRCSICYGPYMSTGGHIMTCLKCGHLFGKSCIKKWFSTLRNQRKRCPSCNMPACVKDIRQIYAKCLVSVDNAKVEELKSNLEKLRREKSKVESDLHKANQDIDAKRRKIDKLTEANRDFKVKLKLLQRACKTDQYGEVAGGGASTKSLAITLSNHAAINLCPDGSSRCLVYSSRKNILIATQCNSSVNHLLCHRFGIRLVDAFDMRATIYYGMHQKPVRDLALSPHNTLLLLSASLDASVKIFDFRGGVIGTSCKVSESLWSCCWDESNPNMFYSGGQKGGLFSHDIRQLGTPVHSTATENKTPNVAIASLSHKAGRVLPQGGVLVCKLNSLHACAVDGGIVQDPCAGLAIPIDGNFVSMRYLDDTNQMIVSTRPCTKYGLARQIVAKLGNTMENFLITHSFTSSSRVTVMAKPAVVPVENDTLIFAHNSTTKSVDAWSFSSLRTLPAQNVRIDSDVVDIKHFPVNERNYLACLSDSKIDVVKVVREY